ncbi:nuclear transport factor 2 family protein [Sphingomonas jatrophae]|uniref:SnoaL-like domain-containing protein n=1 Tax=Sphingomonas jatrophae TaxID=1166337 RepID=A0A1I6KBP1_9SPHN|nr:nuclear transport factor 2 family protein [Sphingomonas jatrophae]SFR88438.1 SnoaL-like domain-containing protein [Sphingomonas jatrophae]
MFELADYLEIQRLVHSYPKLLDRGELEALGQLFAHATVYFETLPDPVVNNAPAITGMFVDFLRLYDGVPRTRHMICNVIIEPVECGAVVSTSSVFVLQDAPGVPLQPIITGDYHDRFEKLDGLWRFAERRITNDLFGNLSAHGRYNLK